jgi:hypothetical protein
MAKKNHEREDKPQERGAESPAGKRNVLLEALRRAMLRRTSTSRQADPSLSGLDAG